MRALSLVRFAALASTLIVIAWVLAPDNGTAAAQPGTLGVSAGGPYSGTVGSPVVFTARVDLGGRPPTTAISFGWDFGDGSSEMGGQTTSHVYSQPGR